MFNFKKINPSEIVATTSEKVIEVIRSNLFGYILVGHIILYFIFATIVVIWTAISLVR